MAEILTVEDDRVIRTGICALLASEGYAVREAKNGKEALAAIAAKRPDLVLLDVMMPDLNGFRVCEQIRRTDDLLPIIFLTAKDSEIDRIRGIGFGADDYLSKDASESLILTCIERALRRAEGIAQASAGQTKGAIRIGAVTVDPRSLAVMENGIEIERLTRSECDILQILTSPRGRTFTKDEIIDALRGKGYACEDAMLYMHISRLRRKLGPVGALIDCVRGAGYVFKT